jgi:hypothetical protein
MSIPRRNPQGPAKTVTPRPVRTDTPAARFAHDFSRIPTVNPAGDGHEREAGQVSDHIVEGPAAGRRLPQIARGPDPSVPPPFVRQALSAPGHPLDPATREFMEAGFGRDFRDVRLHADPLAAGSAKAVGALAYTVGRDIAFASGQLAPATVEGRRLLAHELTHVVQQRQSGAALQCQPDRRTVGARMISVGELQEAGVKIHPENAAMSSPSQFDPLVDVDDQDVSQTHRLPESQVRGSRKYVDNGIVSVGTELSNVFTLEIQYLVFKYQDQHELKIPPQAVFLGPTGRADTFVQRKGVIYPVNSDGSVAYNPANTPTIVQGLLLKLQEQQQGRATNLQAAELVFTFQMNIASLAGAAAGLPEVSFESAATSVFGRAGVTAARTATSTAGAAEDVDQVLMELRNEATTLTQKVSASGTQFVPTKFGSVNDAVFKSLVKQAVEDGRLPATIRTSPSSMNVPGSPGIDVWDTASGRGWDLMTARSEQVLGHEARYVGRTAPDGTLINEVIPLVYSR